MSRTHVVTAFLRHRGEVLLVRRSDAVGTYAGMWGGVSGYVEGDPEGALADARREITEEVGIADASLVRAGDPLAVDDGDREWTIHPFLFAVETRAVEPNEELADWEWTDPTAVLDRETVPALWEAYRRVAPTVESVREDDEHGSAYVSVRALEVLRDEAAAVAAGANACGGGTADGDSDGGGSNDGDSDDDGHDTAGWERVAAVARDLRDARPGMAALANRVNRAMFEAGRTAESVRDAAREGTADALAADGEAAANAADLLAGVEGAVATLSRSGTVTDALSRTDLPLVVAESRPGGEGVGVAERFAAVGRDATLTTDAALAHVAAERDVAAAVVGADAVLPDGSVANKVGTRALALAAAREGFPLYVVAAADKISSEGVFHPEPRDAAEVYDGDAPVSVENPLFDRTPGDLVAGVVTERGVLDGGDVEALAAEHRKRANWDG
ncbi:NUDIX domain-containing protein [Halegenticoccus soli]|uniref:NUDIX domain-containing protein n=1 Tax=Halegenticoccus soli TaxID=1985678 RepID=UPI000C6DD013|nr:NUDIX domain-containing protein [Halegenticoccus soli]